MTPIQEASVKFFLQFLIIVLAFWSGYFLGSV